MAHTMTEPRPIYANGRISRPKRIDVCPPSPQIEAAVSQAKSVLVELYKLDGRRIKVVIVEKG